MGFIKSIKTSIQGQYDDQFKEVIRSGGFDEGLMVKRVTTANGVIQNSSRLFVEPGECAILVDNGAIKDIITESGMYFMDTSAPTLFQTNIFKGIGATFLESMKRIAYQGDTITQQAVYYINLTEQIGLTFGSETPILYKDPTWGPIEISVSGSYGIKVDNPVNLLTDVVGNKEELRREDVQSTIKPYLVAGINSEITTMGLSFDEMATKQDEIGQGLLKKASEKIATLGIEITKVVVSSIDVNDEVKKSMRERTAIKMKATSTNNDEADIYAKLNKAEAMKDLANNPSSNGATIMGMNMGNMFAADMKNNNSTETNNNNQN